MKKSKLFRFIGVSIVVLSSTAGLLQPISVKATDNLEVNDVTSKSLDLLNEATNYLPATDKDLRNQENLTAPQMEAYMAGTAYQSPTALAEGKITGSMTNEQYQEKFADLNKQQNDAWNAKHNFKPETNVKHVSDWNGFKTAFEDNTVSKIVLDKDIYYGTAIALLRKESIEIDGQGHLLEMINGSINVDTISSLAEFGGAFSDVPVFHMHDIQIANNTGYGALEGNLGTAWSFVNGIGEFGTGGEDNSVRRLWEYRVGNIYTPYDSSKKTNNQRVGGRLINGNMAHISVWGYNKVVTGAENFYTGGMTYEPYSYYRGEIAAYNYSTIWFISALRAYTKEATATQEYNVGEGSFNYLHNTNIGTGFPAIYEHFDKINIGKNATFNANTAGSVVSFNHDKASFVAEEGAAVSLLSRANTAGYPTVILGPSNATHGVGNTAFPTNLKVHFKPQTEVFIVGSNTTGVIGYNYTGMNSEFLLDSPETFDIRNIRAGTDVYTAAIGDWVYDRATGPQVVKILNSDISTWEKGTALDGAPSYDYSNVQELVITNSNANGSGTVTSTDTDLAAQYTRPNFKRISGMNTIPVLTWQPVTDADYSQKAQVLIGYTAVGGDEPFDENGDAKVKPVYADSVRKAYVDYMDTLGNTFTAVSSNDNLVHWLKADHETAGFQLAGDNMSAIPYKASYVNGTLTPYKMGVDTTTKVIDVTPPEPAIINEEGSVSPVSKKLTGTGEPHAKITMTLNGTKVDAWDTTVDAEGKWSVDVPEGLLKQDDIIQIFLQDSASKVTEISDPPSTNSANGNINPASEMKYRDATFEMATRIGVQGILELVSAPDEVDFGTLNVLDFKTVVGVTKQDMTTGLVVSDTRGNRTPWKVSAQVVKEMTGEISQDVLSNSLKYVYKGQTYVLSTAPTEIHQQAANSSELEYTITDAWGNTAVDEGLKFQLAGNKVPRSDETYRGTIKWTLSETIE